MGQTEQYNSILRRFCEKDNEYQNWLSEPFKAINRAMASNGLMLVSLPLIDNTLPDFEEKVKNIIPTERNLDFSFSVDELKDAIKKFPLGDIFQDCDACDGYREVVYEFSHGRKTYEQELECPECKGEGLSKTPTGEKEFKENFLLKIGESFFRPHEISELIWLCDTLCETHINLVYQALKNEPSFFKVGIAEILILPVYKPEDAEVLHEINTHERKT